MNENQKRKNFKKIDSQPKISFDLSKNVHSKSPVNRFTESSPFDSNDANLIKNKTKNSNTYQNKLQNKEPFMDNRPLTNRDQYNEKNYQENIENSYKDKMKNFIANYEDLISVIGSNKKNINNHEKKSTKNLISNANNNGGASYSCTNLIYINPFDMEKNKCITTRNQNNIVNLKDNTEKTNKYERTKNKKGSLIAMPNISNFLDNKNTSKLKSKIFFKF